jgi:cytochrome c-type biogenesis protein CcmH/NrfG
MEWGVLVGFALLAVLLIVGPPLAARDEATADAEREETLQLQRRSLLDELVELDEDAAAGRISPEDRVLARRAIAPRLRAVTEALRERGVELQAGRPGRQPR